MKKLKAQLIVSMEMEMLMACAEVEVEFAAEGYWPLCVVDFLLPLLFDVYLMFCQCLWERVKRVAKTLLPMKKVHLFEVGSKLL